MTMVVKICLHRNNLADGQNLVEGDIVHYDEGYDDRKGKSNAINISGGTGGEGGGKGFSGGGKGFGGGGKGFGGGGKSFGGRGFGGGAGDSKGGGKDFGDRGNDDDVDDAYDDELDDEGKGNGKHAIYVAGLSFDTTTEVLKMHFSHAGQVTYAKVMTDRVPGMSSGCGKVEFATEEDADDAIAQFDQTELDGRTIGVRAFT